MKKIMTTQHDLAGNTCFRVVRLNVMNKLFPLGNFSSGVGLRPALVILVLHVFGRPLFSVLIRHENRFHNLYQLLKKRK